MVAAPECSRHVLFASIKTSHTVTTASHNSRGSVTVLTDIKLSSPLVRSYNLKCSSISSHLISPGKGAHLVTPAVCDARGLYDVVEMTKLGASIEADISVAVVSGAEVVSESELVIQNNISIRDVNIFPNPIGVSGISLEPSNIIFRTPTFTVMDEQIAEASVSTTVSCIVSAVPLPIVCRGISVTTGLHTLPVQSPAISGVLSDLTSPIRSRGSGNQTKRPRRLERVLAADDQKFVRDILERSLTQLGYEIIS